MKSIVSTLAIIFSMCSCAYGQCGTLPAKRSKKIEARLNCSLFSIEEIRDELVNLRAQTQTCNSKLEILSKNLTQACMALMKQGKSEVDVTGPNKVSQTIRVDITEGFGPCVDWMRSHCSELNAKVWCLRVGLWRISQMNTIQDDIAEQKLFGPSLDTEANEDDEVTRSKRSTRKLKRIAPKDITHPNTGYRTRKEYRTLTKNEREKYHNAVKELYKDGTFSCFARVHRKGIRLKGVHKGEAFLPWHRAFLALYEEALRIIDPDVSLPYWDSTLDDSMVSPTLSVMWDEEHMGTGHGIVDDGPFAGFVTDNNPLKRKNANGKGKLITQQKIDQILENCRMGDMFKKLEGIHNGVHQWVGGTMTGSFSASDPIFYMHHAFIDLIWEVFRKRQNSSACNFINPEDDYPVFDDTSDTRPTPEGHMPDEVMDGMEFMLNKLGIENFWTKNWYGYDERPSCANNCGNSEDLVCDTEEDACVSIQAEDTGDAQEFQLAPEPAVAMMKRDGATQVSCRTNPYHVLCPASAPFRRMEDKASAFINREFRMPPRVAMIEEVVQKYRNREGNTPPESEPVFFREVVQNDCRTVDTAVYDIVRAMIKGKRIPSRNQIKNVQ